MTNLSRSSTCLTVMMTASLPSSEEILSFMSTMGMAYRSFPITLALERAPGSANLKFVVSPVSKGVFACEVHIDILHECSIFSSILKLLICQCLLDQLDYLLFSRLELICYLRYV